MAAKKQKSKQIRNNWVQFDTLCCGTGWDEADLKNPQIMVWIRMKFNICWPSVKRNGRRPPLGIRAGFSNGMRARRFRLLKAPIWNEGGMGKGKAE